MSDTEVSKVHGNSWEEGCRWCVPWRSSHGSSQGHTCQPPTVSAKFLLGTICQEHHQSRSPRSFPNAEGRHGWLKDKELKESTSGEALGFQGIKSGISFVPKLRIKAYHRTKAVFL